MLGQKKDEDLREESLKKSKNLNISDEVLRLFDDDDSELEPSDDQLNSQNAENINNDEMEDSDDKMLDITDELVDKYTREIYTKTN